MNNHKTGPHVNTKTPHVEPAVLGVEPKARIDCLVSQEAKRMWEELVARDQVESNVRYYPAHTLERMIRAEYQLMKSFGPYERRKKK
ncbi:hypothetical protein [Enterococcus sp. 5B3_DIV0040]|uniref:hypothetical protein n=1 Tax=Enterococcus sp. 5B3_DIV0040 TaxID=1834182 RepID=UPI000B75D47B|nr:hypothetical protein [Enterococcus sp. 5B3_DIV0040]OTO02268.1 hypothetical protein A5883_003095 [Enterococcus sp. 5B3_DIV0040]